MKSIKELPPNQKKIVFWAIIAIISAFIFYLYIKDVQWQVKKYEGEVEKKGFNLPKFPAGEQIKSAQNQEYILENQLKKIENLEKGTSSEK